MSPETSRGSAPERMDGFLANARQTTERGRKIKKELERSDLDVGERKRLEDMLGEVESTELPN